VWYLDMWRRWGRLVGVVLVIQLLERRLLPLLLLAKDLDSVLELRESCSFSVNTLPSGFDALNYCYLLVMASCSCRSLSISC
jgi:hypothetical protein